jgi:hypothetical protein
MLYLQEHKKSAKSETFAQHIFFIRTLRRAGDKSILGLTINM